MQGHVLRQAVWSNMSGSTAAEHKSFDFAHLIASRTLSVAHFGAITDRTGGTSTIDKAKPSRTAALATVGGRFLAWWTPAFDVQRAASEGSACHIDEAAHDSGRDQKAQAA
jgi:hypothetical protein